MITGLVLVERGVEALAASLSALVPAVAQGLIGDAVVLAREPGPGLEAVCDAMGAEFVSLSDGGEPWRAGAMKARGEWCLCLSDGDLPAEGWIRAVEGFLRVAKPDRVARLPRHPSPLLSRLRDRYEGLTGRVRPGPGDIVHRSLLRGSGGPARLARLSVGLLRQPGL
jgi:hypothetical protein